MSGTVRTPSVLMTTFLADNASGDISAGDVRDVTESLCSLPTSAAGTQAGASYTAVLTDRGTVVEMNSASAQTFFIPTNASVAFQVGTVLAVCRMGAGAVTITAVTPGTTTLRTASSATPRAQYSTAYARKRATDEWVLSGDLT